MLATDMNLSDIARLLQPAFVAGGVKRAAVFGSYARGEQREDSDIDVVVEFLDGASLLNLGGLFEDIREITGKDVDIVTFRSLKREPAGFALNVARDAKVIYEAD